MAKARTASRWDRSWTNGNATYADGLSLTPEPASLALMSLVGLPLLRRRRRA